MQGDLDKIEHYISGLADDNEIKLVEELFLCGEDNCTLKSSLRRDWDSILKDTSLPEVKLNHLLDRIHHNISKNEHKNKQTVLLRFTRVYMKVAAILLLPLLIAGGLVFSYLGNQGKTTADRQVSSMIYAPMGARVSFNLPDGTTGMLNGGSKLSYSLPFTNDRRIKLEGEGWFDVNHDEEHPFEVSTFNSKVKVLGTSFNISAYPSENYIEVVLQKGKVEFLDDKSKVLGTILPSERFIFEDGNISKSVTDPAKFSAWTQGRLVFRGDSMAEVGRRIERWYNVKIELADPELRRYTFRATFEDDKLEDVLKFLSMTSPVTYRSIPRKLLPDGTYEKEIITFYLNK